MFGLFIISFFEAKTSSSVKFIKYSTELFDSVNFSGNNKDSL